MSIAQYNSLNIYKDDIPNDLEFQGSIAIDTETLGLIPHRDRLCTMQISDDQQNVHIIQFSSADACMRAKNIQRVLSDESILKIFHYARFDITMLALYMETWALPCYCTKIASKLARTYTSDHGLKHLVKEFMDVTLEKEIASTFWGSETLSDAQIQYAVNDVIFLHEIKNRLDDILKREERYTLAQNCFLFLQTRAKLDMSGWNMDIFSH